MTEKVLRLFPSPVVIADVPGAAKLCADLEAIILKKMDSDPGIVRTNLGGWHSKTDLFSWAGDPGQLLLREIVQLATAHTERLGGRKQMQWNFDGWANVNSAGNANSPHIHGGAYWSAVFYVRIGEGTGGHLIFHDPRMPAIRMHAPMLRLKDGSPEGFAKIKPRAGQIILFPSWLQHSVEPWDGDGSRISIAMNLLGATQLPAETVRRSKSQPSEQGN